MLDAGCWMRNEANSFHFRHKDSLQSGFFTSSFHTILSIHSLCKRNHFDAALFTEYLIGFLVVNITCINYQNVIYFYVIFAPSKIGCEKKNKTI